MTLSKDQWQQDVDDYVEGYAAGIFSYNEARRGLIALGIDPLEAIKMLMESAS